MTTTLSRLATLAFATLPLSAIAVPVTVQVRGPNGEPLAGAAVAVEVKGRAGKTSTAKAEMGQRDRQFFPGDEPIVFDKPGVATLGCNIHDRMSAHIIVVDTPTFARTDDKGQASFDLPPGEHVVKAWHAGQKSPTLQSLALEVPASGGTSALTLAE